ncbi:hypothetical protein GALL_477700 [mine drainage metagenome]|uniref:Uncharacterized protein n=1 Tax=mine drainage metagenome TaxID=410659 RepID=A0A1J5PIK2_9ZZZZ
MVLVGPGRGIADAFHAGRHPVGFLIEALRDVLSGRAAVLGGPVQRFLHVKGRADGGDVVHRTIDLAGRVGHSGNFHHGLHARRVAAPADRRAKREDHAVGGIARGLGGVLIHAPDVAEELNVDARGLAGLHDRDVGGGGVAEIGIIGADALQAQALRAVVAGRERKHQRRQHLEAEFGRERFAGRLRCVGIRMVGAHMHELRLAGLALGLPVLGRPGEFGAQRVGVGRSIEEVVGRSLRLAAGAFRIGERGGIGAGNIRDLVLGQEAGQRLGIRGAPAHDRRDLVVGGRPLLVERDRARHLVAIVVAVDVQLLAADAAVLVDPGERVRDALSIGRTNVGCSARQILKVADGDLGLRRGRGAAEQQRQRDGAKQGFHGHGLSSGFFVKFHCSQSRSDLNAKTGRVSSTS